MGIVRGRIGGTGLGLGRDERQCESRRRAVEGGNGWGSVVVWCQDRIVRGALARQGHRWC